MLFSGHFIYDTSQFGGIPRLDRSVTETFGYLLLTDLPRALKVESLDDVVKTHPDFVPQWKTDRLGGMENPKFGKLSHVVVCKRDGTPLFDQYQIEEKPGAVIIPYEEHNKNIRVGLVSQERVIPGKYYVEVPRGFGEGDESLLETAYRELFEETGLVSKDLRVIGKINPNTAFYATDIKVVAARFENLNRIKNPRSFSIVENIQKVETYSFKDIVKLMKSGRLDCGITQAALFKFGTYKPEFFRG